MIGSHIIPKYYLEQFATPSVRGKDKPGRLWVYERSKEPSKRSTSVQGRENGYFAFALPDGSLEESFETELANHESQCNEVLVCAKSDLFHWPYGSHEKLAFYAALLFSRATQRRALNAKNWKRTLSGLQEATADEHLIGGLAARLGQRLETSVTAHQMRDAILKWVEEAQTASSARNAFLSDLLLNAKSVASDLLKKKPWRILRPIGDSEFVTSDNPLVTFVPLGNGALHPGYGFRKREAVAAFPLASNACLVIGDAWPAPRTLDLATLANLNETIIRLCDRYVYSKTRSAQVQERVDQYGGTVRYGVNAFLPVGLKLPSVREFLYNHFGLDPD